MAVAEPTIKSADRVVTILNYLASRARPVTCQSIVVNCELPRSSTYQLLGLLSSRGFVTHYSSRNRWGLGEAILPLAASYRRTLPIRWLAEPILRELNGSGRASSRIVRIGRQGLDTVAELRSDPALGFPEFPPPELSYSAAGAALVAELGVGARRALQELFGSAVANHVLADASRRRPDGIGTWRAGGGAFGRSELARPAGRFQTRAIALSVVTEDRSPALVKQLRDAAMELERVTAPLSLPSAA